MESDHGRTNGNTLDDNGVARPGIYGIALNGTNRTTGSSDTDAGQYDADATYDRAVGPMQFIPSTWSVVGVDADGDAQRNPQDIDDAALATAVYLCSGDDDLVAPTQGQRGRGLPLQPQHSPTSTWCSSIMDAYLDGDFTSVPNGTTSAGYLVPDPAAGHKSAQAHGPLGSRPPQADGAGGTGRRRRLRAAAPERRRPGPGRRPPRHRPPTPAAGPGRNAAARAPDPDSVGARRSTTLTMAEATAQCIAEGVSILTTAASTSASTSYDLS